jgi:hypothetical protein
LTLGFIGIDGVGQLLTAKGKETGGASRLNKQFVQPPRPPLPNPLAVKDKTSEQKQTKRTRSSFIFVPLLAFCRELNL